MKNQFSAYLLILAVSMLSLASCNVNANTGTATMVVADKVPPSRTIISIDEIRTFTQTESAPTSPEPITLTPAPFTLNLKTKTFLYLGPRMDYGTVDRHPRLKGEKFRVIAKNSPGDWFLVIASDGTQGWLYVAWVSIKFDPRTAPTAEFIPTLPPPTPKPKQSYPND